jgi:hypothetical protein
LKKKKSKHSKESHELVYGTEEKKSKSDACVLDVGDENFRRKKKEKVSLTFSETATTTKALAGRKQTHRKVCVVFFWEKGRSLRDYTGERERRVDGSF